MKSQSTKQARGPSGFRWTARVLIVMAMACSAFVLMSANVALAEPAAITVAPVTDAAAATTPSERSVWADVFTGVAHRADAGSVEAARLALQMHRYGPVVYGISFEATARQLQRWQRELESSDELRVQAG
ncbi:MAG: hypothetical protein E6H58_02870 [Betaproteobacteria bacterium]|nr:MAG: hypothetical protein E6H58_02870 [Betaproteobacteria bacterium]